MSDAWLAALTVQLMLLTRLRVPEAAAVAQRLAPRFGALEPAQAAARAVRDRMVRAEDLRSASAPRTLPGPPADWERRGR